MDKQIFYEGQAVGCLIFGEGEIININDMGISVQINGLRSYSKDGKWHEQCIKPTLYPIEQYRAIIANLPAPQPETCQPKKGEWCCFWTRSLTEAVVLAKFEQKDDNKFMAKIHSGISCYDFCAQFTGELPEHLKEVQL